MIISVGNELVFDKSQFCHATVRDLDIYTYLAGDRFYKITFPDNETARVAFSKLIRDLSLLPAHDEANPFDFVMIPYLKPFKLSKTVITQRQWYDVMLTAPWAGKRHVIEGNNYPAVYVSWDDAVEFCERLSTNGKIYRLPTEAEWEFACRGGSSTNFHFGDDESELGDYAWFYGNCKDEEYAHPVAKKLPNKYGLYDMHGNVWEWCQDFYDDSTYRVIRGGSWRSYGSSGRSGYRSYYYPDRTDYYTGFRVVAE